MKTLIIDDSSEKIGTILNILRDTDNYDDKNTVYALDLISARRHLLNTFFDLLILDLNVPNKIGDIPNIKNGCEFLDEIIETLEYKKPTDIIILTEFEDGAKMFNGTVEHSGFLVLHYGIVDSTWKDILKSRYDYLSICCNQREETVLRIPKCDVAIITAVQIESNAVKNMGYKWSDYRIPNDPSIYSITETLNSKNKQIKIVHLQQSEMGMAAASTITTKLITLFKPKYVIMVGIAAGLGDEIHPGDIMVGTDVWNYSSGKYIEICDDSKGKKTKLAPDPRYINMSKELEEKLLHYDNDVLKEIKSGYAEKVETDLSIHFGPFACGGAVVASEEIISDQITAHSRKTIGLDMESYGVCYATQYAAKNDVQAIIIKSKSDSANSEKSDLYQKYAAYTSSHYVKHIIEKVLFNF